MREPAGPSGVEAALAYALSGAGTLLWVGCVLPAGKLADRSLLEDLATPMFRMPILLVPGLLLLILGPVSAVISRGITGRRGVLAATDTFVCLYASIAITARGRGQGATFWVLTAFIGLLGVLSAVETGRHARAAAQGLPPPHVRGLRLALAILVLLMPSWFLVEEGRELASLLVPFGFVALSAAGARLARTALGLQRVAALQHVIVAGHLFVTLRYTVMDAPPPFARVGIPGWSVVLGAAFLMALALARLVLLLRRRGGWTEAAEEPVEEPGAARPVALS